MDREYEPSRFGPGSAQRPGSIHLSFRSGSRASGACAASAFDYVSRTGEYENPDRDPAVFTESGHMPAWAEDDPREYWDAADLFERANGRLYVAADFALPRELSLDDRLELARTFAHEVTDQERLPYTLAVHAGVDEHGHEHNPHAHLMFSERQNDGIERDRDDWFRRANSRDPARGGASKSRTFHGSEWVERARERWATLVNEKLEERGRADRVTHQSYERQGVDREPGRHYGPSAAPVVGRGQTHERLEAALAAHQDDRHRQDLEKEIERLEGLRVSVVRDGVSEDRDEPRDYSHSSRGQVSDEPSRGR